MAVASREAPPSIAILPWGDVIEDFLDPLGLDLGAFLTQMSSGWLPGYALALARAGYRPVIIVVSSEARTIERHTHEPTGFPVVVLPQPRRHRWLRGALGDPEGRPWVGSGPKRSLTALVQGVALPVEALIRVLREIDARALLVQEYEYTRADRLVKLARDIALPLVATFQGADFTASPLERLSRGRSVRQIDAFTIPSQRERERVLQQYALPEARVHAVPNPIDVAFWSPQDRATSRRMLGLPEDRRIVVSHCPIDIQRKGLDVLFDAWAKLVVGAQGKPPLLLLVGSGRDDDALAIRVERFDADLVQWRRGYTTDRIALRSMLSSADLYVTASRNEGMPLAPLEGMACGLPLLCTDIHGFDDIFRGATAHIGEQVPVGSAAALEAGLTRMLRLPDARLRAMGEAARAHVQSNFSLERVARQLGMVFDGLLGRTTDPALTSLHGI